MVLTYDPIGEGERNVRPPRELGAHRRGVDSPEMGRRLGGLMATDLMQAVTYLRQRPEVDPRRIGAMGYSMGSFVVALTGAIEERLHACVLVGGGNLDGAGEYWDKSKPMCQGLPYQSLQFLGDRPAAIYALHAARGPTLIFNGLADTVVAIPTHGEPFFQDLGRRTALLMADHGVLRPADPRREPPAVFRHARSAQWLDTVSIFRQRAADIRACPRRRTAGGTSQSGFARSGLRQRGSRKTRRAGEGILIIATS
jgi:dienelactone hydrolase